MELLKDELANNLSPYASSDLWNTFRRRFIVESLTLKEMCLSHTYEKFSKCLEGLKKVVYRNWSKKPLLRLDNAQWQQPTDYMEISDDESSEPEVDESPTYKLFVLEILTKTNKSGHAYAFVHSILASIKQHTKDTKTRASL